LSKKDKSTAMKSLLKTQPLHTDLGILLLRLILGGLFTWHGYNAIMHYDEYLAMSKSTIGLGAKLEFDLVVFSYLICGILLLLGFLTRLSVIPIFIAMSVAFFVAHKNDAFQLKQLPFVLWLLCFAVIIFGSGRYSLDALLQKKKTTR
jgi:putative oxidoreductase